MESPRSRRQDALGVLRDQIQVVEAMDQQVRSHAAIVASLEAQITQTTQKLGALRRELGRCEQKRQGTVDQTQYGAALRRMEVSQEIMRCEESVRQLRDEAHELEMRERGLRAELGRHEMVLREREEEMKRLCEEAALAEGALEESLREIEGIAARAAAAQREMSAKQAETEGLRGAAAVILRNLLAQVSESE